MLKKLFLFAVFILIGSVNADYLFLDNLDKAKEIIGNGSQGVKLLTFINKEDSVSHKDIEANYKEVAADFKKGVDLILVASTPDAEFSAKYGLKNFPASVVFKNGIPVNGFEGVYPVDAVRQVLKTLSR